MLPNDRNYFQGDNGGGVICDNVLVGIISIYVKTAFICANGLVMYSDVSQYNQFIDTARQFTGRQDQIQPMPYRSEASLFVHSIEHIFQTLAIVYFAQALF